MNSARLIGLVLALSAFGCNQGHDELANSHDLAVSTDDAAETPPDMTEVDLKGPTCGEIILCVFQCGFTDLACDQKCASGAQPMALQQSGALTLCAATNCLSGLLGGGDGGAGGIGGMLEIIGCIEMKCPMQTNACEGLPFAAPL